jgi:hypothetical protein
MIIAHVSACGLPPVPASSRAPHLLLNQQDATAYQANVLKKMQEEYGDSPALRRMANAVCPNDRRPRSNSAPPSLRSAAQVRIGLEGIKGHRIW